ncbi:acetate/propionate family kinase [Mycoplasmopsis gallopavonis]|uniref:Acetate kinase n=1 Tax=Mycoplasmopsis gallopavonis TaxID=76629 RepID=A0A449AZI5_9BACT|nr:acetate/propionate family kinase [Mycoplasmopsis gallopavonis]RIV16788.1 acetate/propionate family kinase [Mycoplasmopsis gallopavonis]VEU72911.1 acetate kinase [Mycoplasmopsis gallopavonis]
MTQEKVLVINAGSSSIKMSLFRKHDLALLASGIAERIGLAQGNLSIKVIKEDFEKKFSKEVVLENHQVAVEEIAHLMAELELIKDKEEIVYIGFRIVQGGDYFKSTTKIDSEVLAKIDECSMYAPLHNPGAIMSIKGFQKVFPKAKLSADFDTAFHTTLNKLNSTYPIPYELSEKYKVKKYGAHGISHEYITGKLAEILGKEKVTFVNMHLGNGASLCAVKDSQSFDTSMGLTPLAGVMMGTRSGDIDPSIHQFLMKQMNLTIDEFTDLLNKKSGVLGVSGISSDMRDIQNAIDEGNQQADFALELYTQKIADYVAIYANKLGGKLDALVFTAGIGENDYEVRVRTIKKLFFKHIEIDEQKNMQRFGHPELISTPNSEIPVYVIPTNEELVIARNAIKINEQ